MQEEAITSISTQSPSSWSPMGQPAWQTGSAWSVKGKVGALSPTSLTEFESRKAGERGRELLTEVVLLGDCFGVCLQRIFEANPFFYKCLSELCLYQWILLPYIFASGLSLAAYFLDVFVGTYHPSLHEIWHVSGLVLLCLCSFCLSLCVCLFPLLVSVSISVCFYLSHPEEAPIYFAPKPVTVLYFSKVSHIPLGL